MKNHKKFGEHHRYFHERIQNMQEMSSLHFDDPDRAEHYMKNADVRKEHQELQLEMEKECNSGKLKAFCKFIDNHSNIEALSLSYYENKHLNESHFQAFMTSVNEQKNLKKLAINLRWCDQVHDSWMKDITGPHHHETLESFELWICKLLFYILVIL